MALQKKICMLGASGVGKTSLVRRFVQSIYSEKYHTTIGVKIDKKTVKAGDTEVNLLLWDLQGEDDTFKIRPAFLRGASAVSTTSVCYRPSQVWAEHYIMSSRTSTVCRSSLA